MAAMIAPVPCPTCGEKQNQSPGIFDPEKEPFGPLFCVVCGHEFTRTEYEGAQQEDGASGSSGPEPGSLN